jgi:CRP-like cAMP-binding protein
VTITGTGTVQDGAAGRSLFSRNVVGWQVFDCESAERAAALLEDICRRYRISTNQGTVHPDNGGPMKGQPMLATIQGVLAVHLVRQGLAESLGYAKVTTCC